MKHFKGLMDELEKTEFPEMKERRSGFGWNKKSQYAKQKSISKVAPCKEATKGNVQENIVIPSTECSVCNSQTCPYVLDNQDNAASERSQGSIPPRSKVSERILHYKE